MAAKKSTTTLASAAFGYDGGRLSTVTDGSWNSTYTYLANSPLVGQIVHKLKSPPVMTDTRQYDLLNRLASISSTPAGTNQWPVSFGYQYNDANQRTRVTLQDGSFWVYDYDSLGQVISGKRYWSDGTPVPGQQFEYGFDDISNRASTKAGGNAAGTGLRSSTYAVNSLNQYTNRTVPGGFDVVGIANAQERVTINGSAADYRRGEYFQELISVNNGSAPVWQSVSVSTSGGGSTHGNVHVPRTPQVYQYDLDGNLTSDGRWSYVWDAENRLIRLVASTTVGPQQRIDFEYDPQGRRIRKKVWNNTAGSGSPAVDLKFLYDGWNLVAELGTNDEVLKTFQWGLDLSGTEQGAGGAGPGSASDDPPRSVLHYT
jgi:YD repeat-containing protein